jgi:hypothetical protein
VHRADDDRFEGMSHEARHGRRGVCKVDTARQKTGCETRASIIKIRDKIKKAGTSISLCENKVAKVDHSVTKRRGFLDPVSVHYNPEHRNHHPADEGNGKEVDEVRQHADEASSNGPKAGLERDQVDELQDKQQQDKALKKRGHDHQRGCSDHVRQERTCSTAYHS